ncbi:aminodeoxychorismate lyase [Tamilnaduibacter salinus]|uniref:Aminodeoxychorismate lyase n=1 Tax=Tamilnaduibacter salinus TaxID=1484056 RepID=A0A2A2I853_9GAMM|nr:aminotransferase class IV [Tamilnaduibacter salinus]PAV27474.1 aminodeoxychorismate lyase [Tamilnaduibacter salinus]
MDVLWADRDTLPLDDRGLAYGDGLFETIRVQGAEPLLSARHVQRLISDAHRLAIPVEEATIQSVMRQAVQRYGRSPGADWVLKLMLTRGSGGRGYRLPAHPTPRLIVSAHEAPPIPPREGVAVALASDPLPQEFATAGMKSLNRLPQVLASQGLEGDLWEHLMTDGDGGMLEGTRTNLLARWGDQWLTPPVASLAVAGVARSVAIDWLEREGEALREVSVPLSAIDDDRFQGLLLMNSVTGAVVVTRLGSQSLPCREPVWALRDAINHRMGLNG